MSLDRILLVAVTAFALAGCKTVPQQHAAAPAPAGCKPIDGQPANAPNSNTKNAAIGAAIGGVVGGVVGSAAAKKSSVGARNGILLGALTGALVGSKYNSIVGVTEQADGSVKLNIPGSVIFKTGSADISPEFASTLDSVAGTIKEYCGVTGNIVGYTDSTGSAALNKRLSTDRARSVSTYLASKGVDSTRLSQDGRGPAEPVADNATEAGRAQNRRVEIFVRPPAP
jgi:outer membrane protein OmpA-like peptidoglycan-associated protein